MAKLKISGVSKAYGATVALSRGDLELQAGEVHVLIGSNGSGKSTLCKIVAGSVRPDKGEVLLDGKPVTMSGPRASKALGIGIFYQELSLAARRTVEENICLPDLPMKGPFVDRKTLSERAARYIALFDGVTGEGFSPDATVDILRADQRQLVEIMKTLASEASILIFDEPTSALDRAQVDRFFQILTRLKQEGRAIVFISHRMDEIFSIGDQVTVLRDGATIGTSRIADTNAQEIVRMMVGEEPAIAAQAQTSSAASGPVALRLANLSGAGFSDIGFEVRQGEILGLGGLHGQGQSSVLRALFGAGAVTSGDVSLEGASYRPHDPRAAIRAGLAYVSGDRGRDGVIQGRPILENVTPIHFLRNRLRLASPASLKRKATPAVEALKTKFASFAHPIGSLSGGNQQKIVIARWLIDRPKVLLLDDPTKGIDLSAKADLFALVRTLAAEGMAIVLYSSEDAELLSNSDRILVFNGGRITRELTGAERTRFNLYEAAYEAA
ncbi:sugar ABC transporter ATP-binding protein [Aquamicrobium zhengzhouense]|uniref:Sugar ABC transporter ATP-binding protein n=1 Tax=Aquamicrobium zhengzhouense TaxID=2781738 RepID=A0ABS0SDQ7_9HYPH|nr:sugar ABC transporter ATP-binding protein [Aquamicrobium zhengzhouense]MBI1620846.1 sugar ABC transporter ATP-binding protein [Aquamicrobium zhengzhouense]